MVDNQFKPVLSKRIIFMYLKCLIMKTISCVLLLSVAVLLFAFKNIASPHGVNEDQLTGSWINRMGDEEQVLLFIDGYNTHTKFSSSKKLFIETRGGTYLINGSKLTVTYEFDTKDSSQIGESLTGEFSVNNDQLTINVQGKKLIYTRMDNGTAKLAGLWAITGRMQEGSIVPIHRTGTRKTIKILSGSRFQWAAIDPGKKQFSGTGGGTYTFENGKYTETIDFFSRDSSRVGASLSFDGKLEDDGWHHSGLSSKGDKIYEIWSRGKH
jgi:hypothetical protein